MRLWKNTAVPQFLSSTAADLYQDFAASIQRCGKVKSAEISQEKSQLLAELLMEETYLGDAEKGFKRFVAAIKAGAARSGISEADTKINRDSAESKNGGSRRDAGGIAETGFNPTGEERI